MTTITPVYGNTPHHSNPVIKIIAWVVLLAGSLEILSAFGQA